VEKQSNKVLTEVSEDVLEILKNWTTGIICGLYGYREKDLI
jgi:hypothetical protein